MYAQAKFGDFPRMIRFPGRNNFSARFFWKTAETCYLSPPSFDLSHLKYTFMGKGDKKTRRGKISRGSFGVSRPKKIQNKITKKEKTEKK